MKISLKNSGVLNGGAAIPPTAENMEFGEVAINYSATDPAIFIKDSDGIIRRVSGKGNLSFDNYQAVIPIASIGPGTAATGNLYWDQDDERLYIYNGSAWKDASKLPFDATTITDVTNASNQSGTYDDRYLRKIGGTLTGTLTTGSGIFVNSAYIDLNNSNITYQGASNGQGGFFKTTIDAVDATANNTINFPNNSGTVITTGDSGSITASMISSGSITDAQISASAAISTSKIATGTLPSGIQVNSANIVDGSIVNADISSSAAIDLTKLATGNLPSGIQVTTNNFTGGIPASDITSGTLGSGVTVTSDNYQAGSINNAAISNTAEIAVSKLADGSARQLLQTSASGSDVEWASNIDIPGTLDVTGNAVFDGRVTISDVFTVNSTEITLNAPIVNITDKNITLNSVASPTDANANGGGLSVAGSTTKTFTYDVSNLSFTSSEHLNLVSGKNYEINGAAVLNATTLGSGVVNSSLQSVGTISTGTWQGSVINDAYISTISAAGKVANSATTATSSNTPNSIVSRDASGDFTARIISAALSGNASTATALETARTITLTGDLSGSVSFDGTSDVSINAGIVSSVTDTDLSWTPSTMTIGSSTGNDVNLTLFTSTNPGLTPYSGGGTTNFLRADGTWAVPQAASTNLSWTASTSTIESSTGTGVAIPAFDSYNKGLVPSSGGGTTKFLRADGSWVTVGTTSSQGSDLAYVTSTRTVTNTNGDGFTLPEATTSDAGLLSSSDKTKLDGVAAGAEVNTVTSVNGQTGAVTVSGSTDLTYTASTRLLESSTGTDATLPEVVAGGNSGFMTGSDKTKLDSISSNAAVTSVNTATGVVVLDADDIDDTSTNHKFVTASDVTALSTLSNDLAGKADLSNGKLDINQVPDLAISEFKGSVSNQSAMLLVTGEKGDWVIRTDDGKVYVITGNVPTNINSWTALSYPVAPDTNLSYTASTRVLSSSTGTDATIPEVIASGTSGLMTGADKTKLNGIKYLSAIDSGFTDTVQTSSTTSATGFDNYEPADGGGGSTRVRITSGTTLKIWKGNVGSVWESAVADIHALSAGDTFIVYYSEEGTGVPDVEYTYASSIDGSLNLTITTSSATAIGGGTVPGGGTFYDVGIGVSFPYTARVITGSNNPIWNSSLPTVKIGGTGYNTSDWTVSGSTATHNSSNPSISAGDSLVQVNAVHSLGSSGDSKNSLDIYGGLSTLKITDGSTNLSLGLSASTIPANLTLGDDQLTFGNYKLQLADPTLGTGESVYLTNSTYFQVTGAQYANVFIGDGVAANIPTSSDRRTSTFIGYNAGKGNATNNPTYSRDNTAIGTYSFEHYTSTSRENTCLGVTALNGSTSAASTDSLVSNTAIGMGSFGNLKSGQYNTACGKDAGGETSTGDNNLFLGFRAGTFYAPSGRITTGSNIICLGNTDITDIYCSDTTISSSDARDKTDIEDFTPGLDFVNQLRPVTYRWDKRTWYLPEPSNDPNQPELSLDGITPDGTHKQERVNLGFLAQEIEAIEQSYGYATNKNNRLICNLNEDETSYGVKYERLVPVLVNAIKELSVRLTAVENNS